MKLGLIAGNRSLPLVLARGAKNRKNLEIVSICFYGETSPLIKKYSDRTYWIKVGRFSELIDILKKEKISDCVMSGQISPTRVFNRRNWDDLTLELIKGVDWRPHTIFTRIIDYLTGQGINFLDSTVFMEDYLCQEGVLGSEKPGIRRMRDIDFGLDIVSRYVELDVGQTIVVNQGAVVALEALEGTDNTIRRGYRIGGRGATVIKFSKKDQDLRFDIPVVGLSTLKLLRRIKAKALVLEAGRVIILDKDIFVKLADKWQIAVLGCLRRAQAG